MASISEPKPRSACSIKPRCLSCGPVSTYGTQERCQSAKSATFSYSEKITSAITGRWSEYRRALRSVQAERITPSRDRFVGPSGHADDGFPEQLGPAIARPSSSTFAHDALRVGRRSSTAATLSPVTACRATEAENRFHEANQAEHRRRLIGQGHRPAVLLLSVTVTRKRPSDPAAHRAEPGHQSQAGPRRAFSHPRDDLKLPLTSSSATAGQPDEVAPGARQCEVQDLPDDVPPFLYGSRYCDTQKLTDLAWSLFGPVTGGWARVQAICDYVHDRIQFGYLTSGIFMISVSLEMT